MYPFGDSERMKASVEKVLKPEFRQEFDRSRSQLDIPNTVGKEVDVLVRCAREKTTE